MKIIAPDYYPKFACLMGDCRHSCCIGWEIDIDDESLERFRSTGGAIGEDLRSSIVEENGCACFRLKEDERCPFLNDTGLCRLIIELGEDALCQICADHPRFRNFFTGREEIGLGLSCEAAAKLILTHTDKTKTIILEDDGIIEDMDPFEEDITLLRSELIECMQDRSLPVSHRLKRIAGKAGISLPEIRIAEWKDFFLSLERLDEAWSAELERLIAPSSPLPETPEWETAFEQLAVYLLQRHLAGALEDDDLSGRIAFAVLCTQLVRSLCETHADISIDGLCELARMFSAEIEYSDENIQAILDELHLRYPDL